MIYGDEEDVKWMRGGWGEELSVRIDSARRMCYHMGNGGPMAYSDAMLKSMVVNELTARIKLALGRHKSWQASVVQYGGEPADVIEMMKVQNCNCGICGKGLDNVPK